MRRQQIVVALISTYATHAEKGTDASPKPKSKLAFYLIIIDMSMSRQTSCKRPCGQNSFWTPIFASVFTGSIVVSSKIQ
jgi:hypothetical protein